MCILTVGCYRFCGSYIYLNGVMRKLSGSTGAFDLQLKVQGGIIGVGLCKGIMMSLSGLY